MSDLKLNLYYSDRYKDHDIGNHPENAKRMEAISDGLRQSDLGKTLVWEEPRKATQEELQLVHTEKHVKRIESIAKDGGGMADPDTVVSPASFDVACLSAGALLAAVDAAFSKNEKRAFIVSRPPGHHALPDKAMGFCLFNNVAIAARYAQTKYKLSKVLILDWDVHHGNGTQDIFYEDDTVFYISTHQYPHYPGTGQANETGKGKGEGYTMNLPFSAYTPAEKIVEAVKNAMEKVAADFKPQLILISAGFDGHRDDYLGNWLLEENDYASMTEIVVKQANKYADEKVISCLEGGYNLNSLSNSCIAHSRALISNNQ